MRAAKWTSMLQHNLLGQMHFEADSRHTPRYFATILKTEIIKICLYVVREGIGVLLHEVCRLAVGCSK